MTEQFERSLLERAAAVPDVVTVAPDAVWRRVGRRGRARRGWATTGAWALVAAVGATGVTASLPGQPSTTAAVVVAAEPSPTPSEGHPVDRTQAVVDAVDAASATAAFSASLSSSVVLATTAGTVRLSDGARPWCAGPSATGTLTERLLARTVTELIVATLDMSEADVAACYDPLLLVVRVTGVLPPDVESVVADAARLGVTILWVAQPGAGDAATGSPR